MAAKTSDAQSKKKATNDGVSENDFEYVFDMGFTVAVIEEREEEGENYGCGSFAPKSLQFLRRHPAALLAILCILASSSWYIQHGVFAASLPHIEREFHLSTRTVIGIRVCYDIGAFLVLCAVIYLGEYSERRAKWIAGGGALVAFGAACTVMAHFALRGTDAEHEWAGELCGPDHCDHGHQHGSYKANYRWWFVWGEMLIGIGAIPTVVMGISYLDENVTHRTSAVFTAILQICQLIGPMLGHIVTSQVVQIHGDIDKIGYNASQYIEAHPQKYYGAWWIAMIGGAVVSLIGSVIMFPFPRQLSGATVAHIHNTWDAMVEGRGSMHDATAGTGHRWKRELKAVFRNRVFVGAIIEECFRTSMVAGLSVFLAGHLRLMFEISSVKASMLTGGIVILAALVGLCYGTAAQYVLQLDVTGNLRLCLAGAVGASLGCLAFLVSCKTPTIVGLTEPWQNDSTVASVETECNRNCSCDYMAKAVCYHDPEKDYSVRFFSPCFAGCTNVTEDKKYYTDCSCVKPDEVVILEAGRCGEKGCSNFRLYAFLVAISWSAVCVFMRANPVQQVLLRGVHFKLRVTSLAIAAGLNRIAALFGTVAFGYIKNVSCSQRVQYCRFDLPCLWYDRRMLPLLMTVATSVANAMCLLGLVLALGSWTHEPVAPSMSKTTKSIRQGKPPSGPSSEEELSKTPQSLMEAQNVSNMANSGLKSQ